MRPVRRYTRKKDGAESLYWGASRHVQGQHETMYLGLVKDASNEADIWRELARRLRKRIRSE